jgi:sugar phosphate isomerase/epimerase
MIVPGICSITLKTASPEEILQLCTATGLRAIEWWAGGHVLPGDIHGAEHTGYLTRNAGLQVAAYGSYYRTGVSESSGMPFGPVLDAATALGAPTIRIWAGAKSTRDASPADIDAIVADTLRIADLAAARGLTLTFEFHGGTLTDSGENALRFSRLVAHPAVRFSWQPPHGFSAPESLASLDPLRPRLSTLHVYHWTIGSYEKNLYNDSQRDLVWPTDFHRHPLADGEPLWREVLSRVATHPGDHCALLEFVRDDTVEQTRADAATLVDWCARLPASAA